MSNWEPSPEDWPDREPERRRRHAAPDSSGYRDETGYPETPERAQTQPDQPAQPGYDPLGGYERPGAHGASGGYQDPQYEAGRYPQAGSGQPGGYPAPDPYQPTEQYQPTEPYQPTEQYRSEEQYPPAGRYPATEQFRTVEPDPSADRYAPDPAGYDPLTDPLPEPPRGASRTESTQVIPRMPEGEPEGFVPRSARPPEEPRPRGEYPRDEQHHGEYPHDEYRDERQRGEQRRGEAPRREDPSRRPEPAPAAPSPGPTVRAAGRAGRDLPAAIAVSVGLAALILASLYLYRVLFVGLTVVAIVVALWELSHALSAQAIRPPLVPLVVGAVAMLVGAYAGGPEGLAVATALTVLAVMMWRLPDGPHGYLRDMTAGVFAALYVPFLAGFAVLMLVPDDGPQRVTVFILVTALSDIGGYAAGVLFGKHPMAPSISPKKTWEGFAGSVTASVVCGALAVSLLLDGSVLAGMLVGVAAAFTATLGDLGESVIKRDLGIKDMGSLLPGHGGIMDRLDSLLPTAPVVWLLLAVFVAS